MFFRQQIRTLSLTQHLDEELARHIAAQQPVAVLGEGRTIPDLVIHRETDEPAEQQIVIDLLHQLPFAANPLQRHQKLRPQQLLRGNGLPSVHRPQGREVVIQRSERASTRRRIGRSGWSLGTRVSGLTVLNSVSC